MIPKKAVFILGSGFSRAFSAEMPTVAELADQLRKRPALQGSPYGKLVDNPELLLTYLNLNQPWKEPEATLRDQALFVETQRLLAHEIGRAEARAFQHQIPGWATQLVQYFHATQATVITLNYDTVIERCVTLIKGRREKGKWPREFDLYGLPLSPLRSRSAATLGGTRIDTFRLIKLHGSINWFHSGIEGFPGEQVYYRNVTSDSPAKDDWGRDNPKTDALIRQLELDKTPLIIPPVAEKSRFYENRTVRILWTAAREALTGADEVWCIGYSLPETDLTMKLFLRSVARPARVTIVNKAQEETHGNQPILVRYREAFPESEIGAQTFVCENSVQKMTEHLLGNESEPPASSGSCWPQLQRD